MIRFLTLVLLLASPCLGLAETVYVTDLLRLNVTEQANPQGATIQTLTSGDALTVLERQSGYIKVRTSTGEVGWAKAAYLVDEKPARLQLAEMRATLDQLESRLADANKNAQSAHDNAEKLQGMLLTTEKNALHYQDLLDKMKQQNQQYESSMAQFETCVPLTVLLIACSVCLLIGIYLTWYIIDYRLRKRHGGFRL